MKIYTKRGDYGQTDLLNGRRRFKNELVVEAIGTLDELNCMLGIIGGMDTIQFDLEDIMTELSGGKKKITEKEIKKLEKYIDEITKELPELKIFILPTGFIHLARAICRRAERRLVALGQDTNLRLELYQYLNRLGDYLFTLARWKDV